MPDGRIDTRFPRLRFRRHDTHLRSTLLHCVHRKGMGCARTFSSFDSPLQFRPFSHPLLRSLQHYDSGRAPFAVPTRVSLRELTHSTRQSSPATSSRLIACRSPNLASPLARVFPRLYGQQYNAIKSLESVA